MLEGEGKGVCATALRSKLQDTVDSLRDEIVSYAQEILHIESITGNEKRCADWVAAGLREMGLEVETLEAEADRPNVVARLRGTEGHRTLDFNSHTDVVPPGDLKEWVSDPFAAEIRDGKIYARGAADCKGGIICAVGAVKALLQAGVRLKGDILLVFTVGDEESGAKGMKYVVEQGKFKADAAIQGDPTLIGMKGLTTAHMSSLWFEVTVRGKPTHCAFPWEGLNAATRLAQIVVALDKSRIPYKPHPLFPFGPFITSPTTIQGGINRMMVPDRCSATFYMALLPWQSREEGRLIIDQAIEEIRAADKELTVEVSEQAWTEGDFVEEDSEIVQVLQAAAQEVTGVRPTPVSMTGAGSSSYVFNMARTPIVIWGPGDGINSNAHRPNEWVGIEDLFKVTKVYALVAADFLGCED